MIHGLESAMLIIKCCFCQTTFSKKICTGYISSKTVNYGNIKMPSGPCCRDVWILLGVQTQVIEDSMIAWIREISKGTRNGRIGMSLYLRDDPHELHFHAQVARSLPLVLPCRISRLPRPVSRHFQTRPAFHQS